MSSVVSSSTDISLRTLQYQLVTVTSNNPTLNCSQISPILTIKQLCTVSLDIYCLLVTRYQLTARSPDSGLTVAVLWLWLWLCLPP